jgi:hypothetical protein
MKTILINIWNWIASVFATIKKTKTLQTIKYLAPQHLETKTTENPKQFKRKFEILCARPEGMSFKAYQEHLKEQAAWLKNRKKGFLVYVSSEIINKEMEDNKGYKKTEKWRRTHKPFVGSVTNLKPV